MAIKVRFSKIFLSNLAMCSFIAFTGSILLAKADLFEVDSFILNFLLCFSFLFVAGLGMSVLIATLYYLLLKYMNIEGYALVIAVGLLSGIPSVLYGGVAFYIVLSLLGFVCTMLVNYLVETSNRN